MKAIYFTGFMGAGKTTIGKALSEKLSFPVYDTDDYIIQKENRTIEDIFKTDGEEYFRKIEAQVLRALPKENVIITTGGGMILNEENRAYMKENGTVIFLYCSPEVVFERLKEDTSRPLLAGDKKKEIETRLRKRLPLYQEAHFTIDTCNLTIEETITKIEDLLIKS